jgi:hypothetical protein
MEIIYYRIFNEDSERVGRLTTLFGRPQELRICEQLERDMQTDEQADIERERDCLDSMECSILRIFEFAPKGVSESQLKYLLKVMYEHTKRAAHSSTRARNSVVGLLRLQAEYLSTIERLRAQNLVGVRIGEAEPQVFYNTEPAELPKKITETEEYIFKMITFEGISLKDLIQESNLSVQKTIEIVEKFHRDGEISFRLSKEPIVQEE